MSEQQPNEKWQVRMVRPGVPGLDRLQDLGLPELPWLNRPIRPADIGGTLRDVMLTRENMLEDVNYLKVVPNRYIVEVSEANYGRQFRPIEAQILQQWRERLLEDLVTANDRQGRKEFRFGGRLRMEVRPARDLRDNEARVLSRIEPDDARPVQAPGARAAGPAAAPAPYQGVQTAVSPEPPRVDPHVVPAAQARPRAATPGGAAAPVTPGGPAVNVPPANAPAANVPGNAPGPAGAPPSPQAPIRSAYLELVPNGQRWALYPGPNTIGRSESCQIFLDIPIVQEKRLVSGQHAYIIMAAGTCTLYDGAPDGRPSANGTYVNLRRVGPGGYRLQNGDAIVLAAIDPLYPRSDTPGVVTFYFWADGGA